MLAYNNKIYISFDDLCDCIDIDIDYETEHYENMFTDYIDIFANELN